MCPSRCAEPRRAREEKIFVIIPVAAHLSAQNFSPIRKVHSFVFFDSEAEKQLWIYTKIDIHQNNELTYQAWNELPSQRSANL
jgi:hypothetical protein